MICTVCTKPGASWTVHGYPFHDKCAPGYWLTDYQDRMVFMGKVEVAARSRSKRWGRWK